MVVPISKNLKDNSSQWVCLVAVAGQFIDRVLAARMHHDVMRLEPLDPFLNGFRTFDGWHDLREAILLHMADRLRPCAVSHDRPLLRFRNRQE